MADDEPGDYDLPESMPCLDCGYVMDGSLELIGKGSPQPGDLSICALCGAVAFFDDDMHFVRPTFEQQTMIDESETIQNVIRNIRAQPSGWLDDAQEEER